MQYPVIGPELHLPLGRTDGIGNGLRHKGPVGILMFFQRAHANHLDTMWLVVNLRKSLVLIDKRNICDNMLFTGTRRYNGGHHGEH